jgi:tight adherence protein C
MIRALLLLMPFVGAVAATSLARPARLAASMRISKLSDVDTVPAVGTRTRVAAPRRGRATVDGLPADLRRPTVIVAVVAVAGIGVLTRSSASIAICLLAPIAIVVAQRRQASRELHGRRAAVPDLVDLLQCGVAAGLPPSLVITELGHLAPPPLRGWTHGVARRVAHGVRFADALTEMRDPGVPALAMLIDALVAADLDGDPVAPVLDRLSLDARHERRRAAEIEARRLPVRLSFPLVTCILPAFVLLTIAPLLAGAFSSLRTSL